MEKIWIVEEYICYNDGSEDEKDAEGFYTTKEKAIAAIYDDLAKNLKYEDMSAPNVTREDNADNRIIIRVNCGQAYEMYNWYYVISTRNANLDFISAENVNLDFDEYR